MERALSRHAVGREPSPTVEECAAGDTLGGRRGQGERGCWLLLWQVPGTGLREQAPQAI